MIRKALFAALATSLCLGTASAQDSGYYVAPYVGLAITDSDRKADNSDLYGFGVGGFVAPNFAIEGDINRYSTDLERNAGSIGLTSIGLNARLFFGSSSWRPFGVIGVAHAASSRTGAREDNSVELRAGLGLQHAISERVSGRWELLARRINDDETVPANDSYTDLGINFAIVMGVGGGSAQVSEEAEDLGQPRVEPPPPVPTPEPTQPKSNDDDKDGVPNEIDKCPDTPAGQMVSKDGCPVQEVIDLRGVNFDFDKCNLRPDAVGILNNAVEVLNAHSIVVSVEGHTDSRGTDAYNQKLSECRANVVKEYLQNNGVSADKISGSVGFGESRPIDTSETEEGHAQNRRTELVRKN